MKQHPALIIFPAILALGFMALIQYANSEPEQPLTIKQLRPWVIDVETDYTHQPEQVVLQWNGSTFCGAWKVHMPEQVIDSYCISRHGYEILPISYIPGADSLHYETYLQAVKDTMRQIASRKGYIDSKYTRW